MCNLLDDDCDGVIDDDQPCPAGEACVEGKCVAGPADAGAVVDPTPVESGGETSAGCAMVPDLGGALFSVFALLLVALRRRR